MKKITGLAANQLKELVLDHLQGEALELTALRLNLLVERLHRGGNDLFESIDEVEDDPFIQAILGSLNFNELRQKEPLAKSSNLYELLEATGVKHLECLLDMVDKSKPDNHHKVFFIAGLFLGVGASYQQGLLRDAIPWIKTLVQKIIHRASPLLSNMKVWPFLGVAIELVGLLRNLRSQRHLGLATGLSKALQSGLTLTGFTLWTLMGGLTPLAAGLLLASPVLGAMVSAGLLLSRRKKTNTAKNWAEEAEILRDKWVKQEASGHFKTTLFLTLLTATSLSAVLINPTLSVVGLLCLSATPLIEAISDRRLKSHQLVMLQDSLRAIPFGLEPSLCPSTKPAALALLSTQGELKAAQVILDKREQEVKLREEGMRITLEALKVGARLKEIPAVNDELISPAVFEAANEEELNKENQFGSQL